jgi:hypothetical protein
VHRVPGQGDTRFLFFLSAWSGESSGEFENLGGENLDYQGLMIMMLSLMIMMLSFDTQFDDYDAFFRHVP